ncbi:hypothetical protein [Prochlorococcus marinus]|uniref:hypothetical protein n=1 Tax=Prochlorococcus marinus TaxID=1219 RepID=UPI0022B5503E|nr:hypothetical protein [Prochlorococcus marinus]
MAQSKPKNIQTSTEELNQMYSKCVDSFGHGINNGVVAFCSDKVITEAKTTINSKLLEAEEKITPKNAFLLTKGQFLESQSLWEKYMKSQCILQTKLIGMAMEGYCPMKKYLQRNKELDFLLYRKGEF